ncbi:MAG: alcohol dehydrogenase catalytic domain-containing protein, partial [Clostridia bacterium]|nr:alcohol dehydrogenase catalytic domain-containing protein [Clostridia bacterium]
MLQQVMTQPGKIIFQNIPCTLPGKHEVLLKIMRIGVCGSDIHVWHGKHPFTSYPVTQGHEVSARVEALGEGVTDLRVGQKVTVEPQVVCGKCYPCRHGK